MGKIILRGYCTAKEIATYLNVSERTFYRRIKPLRIFLNGAGDLKRLYSPEEWKFVIKNFDFERSGNSAKL